MQLNTPIRPRRPARSGGHPPPAHRRAPHRRGPHRAPLGAQVRRPLLLCASLLCALVLLALTPAPSQAGTVGPDVTPRSQPAVPATAVQRSERSVQLPPVQLLGSDGRARRLAQVIDDGRPVVLTFMFSSCTTVCPVTSQVVSEFVRLLGKEAPQVNVLSVSIDPDHDTVARLAEHARSARLAGAFYTGDPGASEAVQRAFDAWRGDKMNHEPVIFLRRPGQALWVRLDGLVSPQRLLAEYRQIQPS